MSKGASVPGHAKPFILQTALATSLHFAGHEIQSRMWVRDPYALALKYTQTMMGFLLFNPFPMRIAQIGLGGGSLTKFCHRYLPAAEIEVVEINPHVIELRDTFLVPRDDGRLTVRLGDGADFVARNRRCFDVLLVDGYDRAGLASRLCTEAFYEDCRRSLRPGGVMVANIICAHVWYDVLIERIRAVFGTSVLVVQDSESSNDVVYAWVGEVADTHLCADTRPYEIPRDTWDHLVPAMERMRFAWRGRGAAR